MKKKETTKLQKLGTGLGIFATTTFAVLPMTLTGCGDDGTTEQKPKLGSEELALNAEGTLKVTLEYRKDENGNMPAHLGKIVSVATELATSDGTASTNIKDRLLEHNGKYKIIVKYDEDKFDGLLATDGQTLIVHDSWISDEDTSITLAMFRGAFGDMLAKPAVAGLNLLYDKVTNTYTVLKSA